MELLTMERLHELRRVHEDTHPHACMGSGLVFIGTMILDEETGEEGEFVEAIPCRRCFEAREDAL
jgi:hypothetical protein